MTMADRRNENSMTNKRRCSSSALPGEEEQQQRRQRRPSSLTVQTPSNENVAQTSDRRKNVYSWSSTSSCFSTSSTFSSISTPVTTITTATLLATDPHDYLLPLDFTTEEEDDEEEEEEDEDKDDEERQHRLHQRQWRRRVSRSLSRAASNGDVAMVHRILTDEWVRPFLDLDAPDDEQDGTTPLIYAACFGKSDVVRMLLEAGAGVDVQDKRGWTALMWATTNNHSQVVEILLAHGASSNTRSARGRTAFDFVDVENEHMVHILSHQQDNLLPASSSDLRRRRRQSIRKAAAAKIDNHSKDEDSLVNIYCQSESYDELLEQEHRTLMALGDKDDDDDDLAECDASMESIHRFSWDKCLPDQMFVFSEDNAEHILETAITRLTLPMKSRQEIWVPANIIFLCARFAHYYSSRDLLHQFITGAVAKISTVIKQNAGDIHTLAFWIANLSQILHYLKKDTGLVVATAEYQLAISELICETYNLLVFDSERRIAKILEPAMLEHEPIAGLADQVDFADDWHRFFFRRNRNRRSMPPDISKETNQISSSSRMLSPQSITSLLSSILYILQSYEVHPAIILQAMAQFFHFMSCEMFNQILTNKKYLCRSKALQIRMNVTAIEEWRRESQLPSNLDTYFNPLVQLLQLLQCVSQLNELMLFVNTTKTFDLLNPLQIKRCVFNYRYEVSEPRLPDEIEKYVLQIAEDTVRRAATTTDHHTTGSSGRNSSSTSSSSRPASVSSLGSLLVASMTGKSPQQPKRSFDIAVDEEKEEDQDCVRGRVIEKRDSRYMLPFSLPTTSGSQGWGRKPSSVQKPSSLSDTMCQELKDKLYAERTATEDCGVVPTIPEDWMDRLDSNLVS